MQIAIQYAKYTVCKNTKICMSNSMGSEGIRD